MFHNCNLRQYICHIDKTLLTPNPALVTQQLQQVLGHDQKQWKETDWKDSTLEVEK